MLIAIALMFFTLTLISSSGEGNIHLLEDEVATALRACSYNESTVAKRNSKNNRRRRSDYNEYQNQYSNQVPSIDEGTKQNNDLNLYNIKKRNLRVQMDVLNGTVKDPNYDRSNASVKFLSTASIPPEDANKFSIANWTRSKRGGFLINKSHKDQCLSQCVFANLQVVDGRGIPREAELWNMVQSAVTSQQSRTLLKDQIRACFQELQSEAEDNGCSYSNKLERCLMLRFSDRKINEKVVRDT